jgi:hypothetical protein
VYQVGTKKLDQKGVTKMEYTNWNRSEAEQAAAKFTEMFPEVSVHVMDIHDEKTKEYQYSFFSLLFKSWPMGYVSSGEELQNKIEFCQYIAQTIVDNQQSEEHDSVDLFREEIAREVIDTLPDF